MSLGKKGLFLLCRQRSEKSLTGWYTFREIIVVNDHDIFSLVWRPLIHSVASEDLQG